MQRRSPSVVCSFTSNTSERADAFQWIDLGSSPSTYSRKPWKSPGPNRRAMARSWAPSTPWPSCGMSSRYDRGATNTSSTSSSCGAGPGHAERITILDHERTEPHDPAPGRHQLVAGRREATARHGADRESGAVERRSRSPNVLGQRELARTHRAEVFDAQVDPPDVTGHEHRRMDPSAGPQARATQPDDRQRDARRRQEAGADDEQLENAEHPGRDDRDDSGPDGHETLTVQHRRINARSERARPRRPR